MKKKILAVAMVATMALASAMTAMAAVPDPTAYYNFDENIDGAKVIVRDDTAATAAEKLKEGTATQTYINGVVGKALNFEGIKDDNNVTKGNYGLLLENVKNLTDTYTVSFWMQPQNYAQWAPFVAMGNDIPGANGAEHWAGITYNGTMAPQIWSRNATNKHDWIWTTVVNPKSEGDEGYCATIAPLGVWSFVTVTVDASKAWDGDATLATATVYYNGENIGTTQVANGIVNTDDNKAYWGINPWDQLYLGAVDELKFWAGSALTADQVKELYEANKAPEVTTTEKETTPPPSTFPRGENPFQKTQAVEEESGVNMVVVGVIIAVVVVVVIVAVIVISTSKKKGNKEEK